MNKLIVKRILEASFGGDVKFSGRTVDGLKGRWYQVSILGEDWWALRDTTSPDGVTLQATMAEVRWYDGKAS